MPAEAGLTCPLQTRQRRLACTSTARRLLGAAAYPCGPAGLGHLAGVTAPAGSTTGAPRFASGGTHAAERSVAGLRARGGRTAVEGNAGGGPGTRDPAQFRLARAHRGDLRRDAGISHEPAHFAAPARRDQGDDAAGLTGAGGAPCTVQIVLVVAGRVDVDHQVEVVHVQARAATLVATSAVT